MSDIRQSSMPDIGLSTPIISLDWLRGIASLMVCFFHVKKYIWWTYNPNWITKAFEQGYLGVYIFFIVSGFVIPYSMCVKNYQLKSCSLQPLFLMVLKSERTLLKMIL